MPDDQTEARERRDKSLAVYARWDAMMKARLRPLINDSLIAEHEKNPLGQHSDALERVLNYLRRAPQRGKYVVICTKPYQEWRVGVLSGVRGEGPKMADGQRFGSEAEALHGVFIRRINDLTRP